MKTSKHLILEDFEERIDIYKEVNDLLLLACILDPCFKKLDYLDQEEQIRPQIILKEKYTEYQTTQVTLKQNIEVIENIDINPPENIFQKIFKFSKLPPDQNSNINRIIWILMKFQLVRTRSNGGRITQGTSKP